MNHSPSSRFVAALLGIGLVAAACGGDEGGSADASDSSDSSSETAQAAVVTEAADTDAAGIRLVSASEGAALQATPPSDLVILDVRTPEEYDEGHLDGAIMIDFYEEDFADQLAGLDPDVPYLLYCRSGNRSGQTAALMKELGFADVADVDGGVIAWGDAGLPLVTG